MLQLKHERVWCPVLIEFMKACVEIFYGIAQTRALQKVVTITTLVVRQDVWVQTLRIVGPGS